MFSSVSLPDAAAQRFREAVWRANLEEVKQLYNSYDGNVVNATTPGGCGQYCTVLA
jgi:hypothetical protein